MHLVLKISTLRHTICTYIYTRGKPLVQKSADWMPSGTILKTVKKVLIYIFANK